MNHSEASSGASCLSVKPSNSASFSARSGSQGAFTLTELMVILAIVAILGGLLFPALAATHDRSNRALCQSNLRQIAVAVTQYAGENNDYIFPAGFNLYPLQFDWSETTQAQVAKVGITTNAGSIWTCPNRPTFPVLVGGSQLIIGYQYYGGITNWINAAGNFPSHSPIKLSQSKPYWMLAADLVAQPDGINWYLPGDGTQSGWYDLPAHHTADTMVPQGGNEVFCDGSVQWIDIHKMYMLHSWADPSSGGGARNLYFYQDLTDYPLMLRVLPALNQAGVTSPGTHY